MPLDKEERAICWKARDDYWACLDNAEAKKNLDPESACKELLKIFESKCPSQWVCVAKIYNKYAAYHN
jgi:cytochrome c oxidase assembly factor 6